MCTASEAKAKQAEQILRDAEAEAKKAQAEFQKQEDDYKAAIKALEDKKNNESLGMVARNKASQELAQLKEKDPLPLRRAKITQDAAVRKVLQSSSSCLLVTRVCVVCTGGAGAQAGGGRAQSRRGGAQES